MKVSIKYDEVLQRLPAVKAHNLQNPYADIFPSVVGIDFPVVNYPDFELFKKELLLYAAPAGLHNGTSMIALADLNDGVLIITNKRVAFNVDSDSFQCPIGDVVACKIVNDELVLIETNTITYTFMVNKEVTPFVRNVVTAAKSWHDGGHDLFETQEHNRKVLEPFKQSDFYQSLRRKYEELILQK